MFKLDFSKVKEICKGIYQYADKNSPTILSCVAIAEVIVLAIEVGKATPKYQQLIKEDRENRSPDVGSGEIIKREAGIFVKSYWKAGLSGGIAIASIISSNRINLKRNAALLAAYELSDKKIKAYKEKLEETVSKKQIDEVENKIVKKNVSEISASDDDWIRTKGGNDRCYDSFSGRKFYSSAEFIRRAINEINSRLNLGFDVSLNDFYEELDLAPIDPGDLFVWNFNKTNELASISLTTQLTKDDHPCLVIKYNSLPDYVYRED